MGEAPGSLSGTILGEEPLRGLPVPVIWRTALDFVQTACVDDRNPRREQGLRLAGLLDWWSLENPRSIRRSRLCGDRLTHPPPHSSQALTAASFRGTGMYTPASQAGRDGVGQAVMAASERPKPLLDASGDNPTTWYRRLARSPTLLNAKGGRRWAWLGLWGLCAQGD